MTTGKNNNDGQKENKGQERMPVIFHYLVIGFLFVSSNTKSTQNNFGKKNFLRGILRDPKKK